MPDEQTPSEQPEPACQPRDAQPGAEKPASTTASELELTSLRKEVQDCKDKYLRLLAESENTRKRLQKEREDFTKYAIGDVISEFLHPMDSFEKALKFAETMSSEVKNWAFGFEMILAQFKQVLQNHGIIEFESLGKPFDPHFHDGVESVETDEHEPGFVVFEFVKGYKMGDRVIRPARVKVSKAPSPISSEETKGS